MWRSACQTSVAVKRTWVSASIGSIRPFAGNSTGLVTRSGLGMATGPRAKSVASHVFAVLRDAGAM
jgi:hypothetical protein